MSSDEVIIDETNMIDYVASKIKEHIPSCNTVWAYSNALALQQIVMDKYILMTKLGKTRANDYYCNIGTSGSWKSQVTNMCLIPILKEVNPQLLLPSDGSKEGFVTYMVKNDLTAGIIDHDEISKFYRETQGKGYKSGDTEMLCKLWDGRSINTATILRGNEQLVEPYIVMMATGTHVFLEMFETSFFRNGLGNRILWSFTEPESIKIPDIESDLDDFFPIVNTKEYKELFSWQKKVSDHLKLCITEKETPMSINTEAKKIFGSFFSGCMEIWRKQAIIDATNWQYSAYNRYPHHLLKTAMGFSMGDTNNLYFKDSDIPLITKKHMDKALNFLHFSIEQYLKMIPWKLRSTTKKPERTDYSVMAAQIYANIKDEDKNKLMFLTDFYELIDIEIENERRKVKKIFEDRGWLKSFSRSHLTQEELEKLCWTKEERMRALIAVSVI